MNLKIASLIIILIVVIIFLLNKEITISVPVLKDGEYLKLNSDYISTGRWSVPFIHDWDSDGKKDLLVGYREGEHGYVAFFKNIGSDDKPYFTSLSLITANGEYIDHHPDG